MEKQKEYIDFQVAPYALPKVCEALYRNGVTDACITQEDGDLHIRWEFRVNRYEHRLNVPSDIGVINSPVKPINEDLLNLWSGEKPIEVNLEDI